MFELFDDSQSHILISYALLAAVVALWAIIGCIKDWIEDAEFEQELIELQIEETNKEEEDAKSPFFGS